MEVVVVVEPEVVDGVNVGAMNLVLLDGVPVVNVVIPLEVAVVLGVVVAGEEVVMVAKAPTSSIE